jgi:uncharacterized membrane protein YkvA (DUF1232 family)
MIACWLYCIWRLMRLSVYRFAFEATLLSRVVVLSKSCPLSKIALFIGIGYWFGPVDLIPNSIPYYGYLDQVGFLSAGLVAARFLVPPPRRATLKERRPPPVIVKPYTIVFCHCPKTAGTSLFRALSDRLGYRASYLMRRRRHQKTMAITKTPAPSIRAPALSRSSGSRAPSSCRTSRMWCDIASRSRLRGTSSRWNCPALGLP